MDRLTGMAVFVKVVELGSFSAAADALEMSPQLVGRHVQDIEQRLGVQLLHRTTRRQSLTDFGRTFYERSKIVLAEVEAAESLAAETRVLPTGKLRILEQHECLVFALTELRARWSFDGPEGRVVVPVRSRLVADHDEALLCAALAGMGILLQPLEVVGPSLADGSLVRLLPDYQVPTRPMHMLYAPDRRITPKLRSFLDFAVQAFGPEDDGTKRA